MTTIRFGATFRAAEDLLRDAQRMQRAETPPKLLLNDHCSICEFHVPTLDQAQPRRKRKPLNSRYSQRFS
jgi:hypothetical protein